LSASGSGHDLRETAVAAAWALLWGAAAAAACAVLTPLEPDLIAEGLQLHVAERLAGGEQLYLDVAVTGGPLPFETLALLFRHLGTEVGVARATVVMLSGLGATCAFGIARVARAGVLAHAAGAWLAATPALLFPDLSRYTPSVLALHLSLAAGLAAVAGLRSRLLTGVAGVCVAGVALSLPSVGLALAMTLTLALVLVMPRHQRVGRIAALLAGATLALASFAWAYPLQGRLPALASSLAASLDSASLTAWARTISSSHAGAVSSLPGLYRSLSESGADPPTEAIVLTTQLLFALPLLALGATLTRRVIGGRLSPPVWILAAVLAAWLVHLGRLPAWPDLAPLLPLAGLLVLLVGGSARGSARDGPAARVVATTWVILSALAAGLASYALYLAAGPASYGPRVPLRPVSAELRASDAPEAIRYVRERVQPDEPILVLGNEPLLYFATGARNPTPYPGLLPGPDSEGRRHPMTWVEDVRLIISSELTPSGAAGAARDLALLQPDLERHFRIPASFRTHPIPRLLVLERGPDRGAVALDLVERADTARRWIRDEDGALLPARRSPPDLRVRSHRRPLPFVLGLAGGGLDFALDLPENAWFEADVGLAPLRGERDYWHPSNALLAVSVGREGSFERVGTVRLAGGHAAEADWQPLEVDLSSFGAGPTVLRLELEPGPGEPPSSVAWWGSPRIVSRGAELR
jgi:hypothetical protein